MNISKRFIAAVSAFLMAASVLPASAAFAESDDAAAESSSWSENETLPDWIPTNYIDAMAFTNMYGAAHAEGEYVCVVQERSKSERNYYNIDFEKTNEENGILSFAYNKDLYLEDMDVPEIPDKEKDEKAYNEYMDNYGKYSLDPDGMKADNYYKVIVFSVLFSDVDVTVEYGENTENEPKILGSRKYTFGHTSSSLVTEEFDAFAFLPDCMSEYNEFKKKYGRLSIHDDYVVFCDDINYSAGCDLEVENSAPEKLAEVMSYSVISHYPLGLVGVVGEADHVVKVFKASDIGDAKLKFTVKTSSESREFDEVTEKNYSIAEREYAYRKGKYKIIENSEDLPEWIPSSFEEAMDFDTEYGATHIEGEYVCCVRKITNGDESPDENIINIDTETSEDANSQICKRIYVPDGEPKDGQITGITYEVEAFKLAPSTILEVQWSKYRDSVYNHTKYSFESDKNGIVTETDIYGWLPDCVKEARAYKKTNNMLSVRDDCVVYCNILHAGTGYDMDIATKGIARIKRVYENSVEVPSLVPVDGGAYADIFIYKATRPGTATLTCTYGRSFDPDEKKEKTVKAFSFNDDLKADMISVGEVPALISGDCNYDGAIGISDYITLKNWLHTGGAMGCEENADMNNDGSIDVFDLIAMKKLLINGNTVFEGLKKEPAPMLVGIYDNFAWGRQQEVTVYDENGVGYSMSLGTSNGFYPDSTYEDDIVISTDSDWYDRLVEIIKNDKAVKSEMPDYLVTSTRNMSSQIEYYTEETGKTGMGIRFDGGTTTYYLVGKDSDGKPTFAKVCQSGDVISVSNDKLIKDYVKTGSYEDFFMPMVYYNMIETSGHEMNN